MKIVSQILCWQSVLIIWVLNIIGSSEVAFISQFNSMRIVIIFLPKFNGDDQPHEQTIRTYVHENIIALLLCHTVYLCRSASSISATYCPHFHMPMILHWKQSKQKVLNNSVDWLLYHDGCFIDNFFMLFMLCCRCTKWLYVFSYDSAGHCLFTLKMYVKTYKSLFQPFKCNRYGSSSWPPWSTTSATLCREFWSGRWKHSLDDAGNLHK